MKTRKITSIIIATMLMVFGSINSMEVVAADNAGKENVEVKNEETVLNLVPNINNVHLEGNFVVSLDFNSEKEAYATELKIKYDDKRLEFLGFDEVDGIFLVKHSEKDGVLTIVLASLGEKNVMIGNKPLIKINFKGISSGEASINVTKAIVADTVIERKLVDKELGQTKVNICDRELINVN